MKSRGNVGKTSETAKKKHTKTQRNHQETNLATNHYKNLK